MKKNPNSTPSKEQFVPSAKEHFVPSAKEQFVPVTRALSPRPPSRKVAVQVAQPPPDDRPVLEAHPHDPAASGIKSAARERPQPGTVGVRTGSSPPGQPAGAGGTDADLRVTAEPGELLLLVPVCAAPALSGSGPIGFRRCRHTPIIARRG